MLHVLKPVKLPGSEDVVTMSWRWVKKLISPRRGKADCVVFSCNRSRHSLDNTFRINYNAVLLDHLGSIGKTQPDRGFNSSLLEMHVDWCVDMILGCMRSTVYPSRMTEITNVKRACVFSQLFYGLRNV
jgi:hypothetical protein